MEREENIHQEGSLFPRERNTFTERWQAQSQPQSAPPQSMATDIHSRTPAEAFSGGRDRLASLVSLQEQLVQRERQRPEATRMGMRLPGSIAGTPPAIVGEQYLIFTLLEQEFAFKAEHIQAVERLVDVTPLPNVAQWVKGVLNLRGSIASVVDLRVFLDREQLPPNPRTRLLSLQANEMVVSLVVDAVSEMVVIPPAIIAALGTHPASIPRWVALYAIGSATVNDRLVVLLDATRLLFSEKMQHYSLEL